MNTHFFSGAISFPIGAKTSKFAEKKTAMDANEIKPQEKIDVKEILNGISNLTTAELENIHRKVGSLLTVRKAKSFPARERFLSAKIKESFFSDETERRFNALRGKSETDGLNAKERQEYNRMLKETEAKSLERLACLVELSQLRGISLVQTMKQSGLNAIHPSNA